MKILLPNILLIAEHGQILSSAIKKKGGKCVTRDDRIGIILHMKFNAEKG